MLYGRISCTFVMMAKEGRPTQNVWSKQWVLRREEHGVARNLQRELVLVEASGSFSAVTILLNRCVREAGKSSILPHVLLLFRKSKELLQCWSPSLNPN